MAQAYGAAREFYFNTDQRLLCDSSGVPLPVAERRISLTSFGKYVLKMTFLNDAGTTSDAWSGQVSFWAEVDNNYDHTAVGYVTVLAAAFNVAGDWQVALVDQPNPETGKLCCRIDLSDARLNTELAELVGCNFDLEIHGLRAGDPNASCILRIPLYIENVQQTGVGTPEPNDDDVWVSHAEFPGLVANFFALDQWHGDWVIDHAYVYGDSVRHGGSVLVCIQANTGQEPDPDDDTAYWVVFIDGTGLTDKVDKVGTDDIEQTASAVGLIQVTPTAERVRWTTEIVEGVPVLKGTVIVLAFLLASLSSLFAVPITLMKDSVTNAVVQAATFTGVTKLDEIIFTSCTEKTIASGVITITQGAHTVDGEGDAADDLVTIAGGTACQLLLLKPENAARNITIKHNTGNIHTSDAADFVIPDDGFVLLYYNGTDWLLFSSGGSGTTGAVLADGTVPLTANWDAGAFEVRALTLESDQVTGTAPFTVASTTVVTNLNADLLDGYHSTSFMASSSATAWYAVSFTIPNEPDDDAQHFEVDIDDSANFGSIVQTWDSRDVGDGGDGQAGCTYFNGTQWAAWTAVGGVIAAYEGQRGAFAFQSASIVRGTLYYWRIRFHDGTAWGDYAGGQISW